FPSQHTSPTQLYTLSLHDALPIYPYTPLYKIEKKVKTARSSQSIKIISTNIYQFNKEYNKFTKFILKQDPDIILTMESNKEWERSEEHTSELQSRENLVCRLLLEK